MEQRAGRRGAVVFLAVAIGLLVAATALFVVLYVKKQTDLGKVSDQIRTTEVSVADQSKRLTTVKAAVADLDTERSQLSTTNAKLRLCSDAARNSVAAAQRSDRTAFDAAMARALVHCRR
ncbi:hypothetical protein [Kibdelosporangium phytohabitans]|uniref:Uncharacterized protein n=1 Tax=Kibdelosporangium phytohabitans TaxID=860235 RepID=A0A0N9I364_9PSEU|nr:hypothetical protein [Kibdelosporangium phytohabitans]ALG09196.1 hypothetical protein AOZ06_21805 [Kibdelosporangium phytohabitans]MBE1469576.1 biopolymer transport protein ExbB/TolQ [Kibdelosporangium phytohabitans]